MPTEPTREQIITEAWYPRPDDYWVPAAEADERPNRYGDLFHTPAHDAHGAPLTDKSGVLWHAVMALSPSCELIAKAKPTDTVEVARVLRLDSQASQAAKAIVAGWQEKNSRITIAFAHTVFLAPVPDHATHAVPMFAHLKSTTRVTLADLRQADRIAALDHDARVSIIRRDIYYRYRWLIPRADVEAAEQNRISNDPHFAPPRPDWAPLAAD